MEAKARASGNVVVEGKLMTLAGNALGPGTNFTVRVRPNWESWGMIVIGSMLGFLLVIGLLRSLRRNRTRTRVPIEAVPDVDEAATRRAAGETESNGPSGSGPTGSGPAGSGPGGSGPPGSGPPGSGPPRSGPPGSRPPGASAARSLAPPVFVPIGAGPVRPVTRFPSMTPDPGPEPDPQSVPDPVPVPISMTDLEPDPKAMGGPVKQDGVRPPPRTRAAPAARPG